MSFARSILGMCLFLLAGAAFANPQVNSREYKLLLNPEKFRGSPEQAAAQVDAYWNVLADVVRASTRLTPAGNFNMTVDRTTRYYDTPGSCLLLKNGLSFRERIQGDGREISLKQRMPGDGRATPAFDIRARSWHAKDKLEEDIGGKSAVVSNSSKQTIAMDEKLASVADLNALFPGTSVLRIPPATPFAVVGGLNIRELVYRGADMGHPRFSLTLWYAPSSATEPVAAEISFKYSIYGKKGVSQAVMQDAVALFKAMHDHPAILEWNAVDSMNKTEWIYAFVNDFCTK